MIEVTGITKRYGDTLAVDDLSFQVRPGQITGFLGPNGSGKSTTMRMIMGLDNPDAGYAKVNGTSYGDLGWPLREVGALLEAKAIHPGRSARNHLWMLAQTNDIPRSRVDEVLEIVGLASVADPRRGHLLPRNGSAARDRRAPCSAIPACCSSTSRSTASTPKGSVGFATCFKGLGKEGRTVFVSSHLMSEMALTADHLVVIGRGLAHRRDGGR